MKIISGGQTGVDRAALDFGITNNIETGGFCPKGRMAEDGVISDKYNLVELSSQNYSVRTLKNVVESDATFIFFFTELSGGTLNTREFCVAEGKPFLLINLSKDHLKDKACEALEFITNNQVKILNIAGPRHSKCPECYRKVYDILAIIFREEAEI